MHYFCYLLVSVNPKYKNHTYIGFTVSPERRIRQHNGELPNGAKKTSIKRPWEMVCVVHGFTTKESALQFEWALQNPTISIKVRDVIKSKNGIGKGVFLRDKIKIMWEMCCIPPWSNQPLVLNVFPTYTDYLVKLQKEKKYTFPDLPVHVEVQHKEMQTLPTNIPNDDNSTNEMDDVEPDCYFCEDFETVSSNYWVRCPSTIDDCQVTSHVHCFAEYFLRSEPEHVLIPSKATCPECDAEIHWPKVISTKYKFLNAFSMSQPNPTLTASNEYDRNEMSD